MKNILAKFLSKSFSKLASNATVSNSMIAYIIQTAAMTQDFMENTSKKLGNKPNADIIFKRINESDIDKLKAAFIFILDFMILNIRQRFNKREWILAIDTHYEAFYGSYKDLWVHGYRPKDAKDCHGSYCYITIAIVIGNEKFTILALPVHTGQDTADLIEELILAAKKYLKIKLVLLDRGFDSGSVSRKLNQMGISHIIFVRKNDKIKRFFEETPEFGHRYFYDQIEWTENKSTQREKIKYLIIRDYIDLRTFKIYDWSFITNLSNVNAISYVHLYMKRWCIETSYKLFNQLKIKTISTSCIVRYFFFMFRILLYNLWKFYNIVMNTSITMKQFVFKIFLASLSIDHIISSKDDIKKFMSLLKDSME